MKAKWFLATRLMTVGIALTLAGVPELARAAQEPAPPSEQTQPAGAAPSDQKTTTNTSGQEPDSPGATKAQEQQNNPPANGAASEQSAPPPSQTPPNKKPLGTAAAEPLTPTGTGASEPAGVAIAPAKQRRARSLLIKVAAIVAAGAAVGTVYALSSATNSKPPGSH